MADQANQEAPRTAADIEAELYAIADAEHALELQDSDEDADDSNKVRQQTSGDPDPSEALAAKKGWVPKEKFKGPAEQWVDAETFLDRGANFSATLKSELAAVRAELEAFKGTAKAFAEFQASILAQKDAELRSVITDLRKQKSMATREGDDDLVIEIEDRIALLKEEAATVKTTVQEETLVAKSPEPTVTDFEHPVIAEWISEGNEWFRDDKKLYDYAIAVGNELVKADSNLRGRKLLDRVRLEMEQEFPRRFKAMATSQGQPQNPVNSASRSAGTRTPTIPGGKSERDLPAEDLRLMKQFIKEGWVTKDKFLADYFTRN